MCLKVVQPGVLKELKFKIAEDDIVCYKIAVRNNDDSYCTRYQYFHFKLGETYQNTEEIELENYNPYYIENIEFLDIGKGLFHAFVNEKDARYFLNETYQTWERTLYIIKCVIPKGTEYVEGDFGTMPNYGSRAIKFVSEEPTISITLTNTIMNNVEIVHEND